MFNLKELETLLFCVEYTIGEREEDCDIRDEEKVLDRVKALIKIKKDN